MNRRDWIRTVGAGTTLGIGGIAAMGTASAAAEIIYLQDGDAWWVEADDGTAFTSGDGDSYAEYDKEGDPYGDKMTLMGYADTVDLKDENAYFQTSLSKKFEFRDYYNEESAEASVGILGPDDSIDGDMDKNTYGSNDMEAQLEFRDLTDNILVDEKVIHERTNYEHPVAHDTDDLLDVTLNHEHIYKITARLEGSASEGAAWSDFHPDYNNSTASTPGWKLKRFRVDFDSTS